MLMKLLEIKTFGIGYTIGDVVSEICSITALCVTSDHWDVGLNLSYLRLYLNSKINGSINNFETKIKTKIINLSCKFLTFKAKK
jgi:hypothetical protein